MILSGIYKFWNISVKSEEVNSKANLILLVITRWDSFAIRTSWRAMVEQGTKNSTLHYKLLFLFSFSEELRY